MKHMYVVTSNIVFSNAAIKKVCVQRSDKNHVFINGQAIARRTIHTNYFDTYQDARKYILERMEGTINRLELLLLSYKNKYADMKKRIKE